MPYNHEIEKYNSDNVVTPYSTYSPWHVDFEFQNVYSIIKEFSLVDEYRCFELWELIEQSSKFKEGNIIEVGTWRGGSGALIAKQAKNCGLKNKVFLCDTFTGIVKVGKRDSHLARNGAHDDTNRQDVEKLIYETMKLDNVEILEGIFPDDTGYLVEDFRFRFCHIDVDIYQSAKDITEWIWDKMVVNGIIVYDDCGFSQCKGITDLVEEQMNYDDRIVIYNLNGHAIVIKV